MVYDRIFIASKAFYLSSVKCLYNLVVVYNCGISRNYSPMKILTRLRYTQSILQMLNIIPGFRDKTIQIQDNNYTSLLNQQKLVRNYRR